MISVPAAVAPLAVEVEVGGSPPAEKLERVDIVMEDEERFRISHFEHTFFRTLYALSIYLKDWGSK